MTRKEYIEDPKLQLQESLLLIFFSKEDPITIFDIGACEGESSVRYARLFPNANIYAFEPLPSNFNWVQKNIQHYRIKNIYPLLLCLSDGSGETEFHVSSGHPDSGGEGDWDYGNKSSSLLAPAKTAEVHSWLKFDKVVTVKTDTLDNFCSASHISDIDFIHMDVQGAELLVLKGAKKIKNAIKCIWLEVEAVELYKGQPLKRDIEHFMQHNGFVMIADTVYGEAGDQFWVRHVFVRQQKLQNTIRLIQLRSALLAVRKRFIRRIKRIWNT